MAKARKDNKGRSRYSPQVYEFEDRQFVLTNDLYAKNVEKVRNLFTKLGLISAE